MKIHPDLNKNEYFVGNCWDNRGIGVNIPHKRVKPAYDIYGKKLKDDWSAIIIVGKENYDKYNHLKQEIVDSILRSK